MNNTQVILKNMTADAFALLGTQEVVYIKPVNRNGVSGFAVHAANGEELAILESREAAFEAAVENDMTPTQIH